jgi:hypothetical protein
MNKFFTYAVIFTTAAVLNPFIVFISKLLKQLGFSDLVTGILTTISFWLLMLTVAQLLMIFNESKPIEYIPASIDEFPSLDWHELEQYTNNLESMGFDRLQDYTQTNLSRPGLARLFAHADYHCFVEVFQISGLPMICVVRSIFTDQWSLCNMNYQSKGLLGGISYMRRRKRNLWIAQPSQSPSELLSNHLERRATLISDLHIAVLTDMSAETYFSNIKSEAKLRLQIMKSKWIVISLMEAIGYMINPKSEWMGDYKSSRN